MRRVEGYGKLIRLEKASGDLYYPSCEFIEHMENNEHPEDVPVTYYPDDAVAKVLDIDLEDKELPTDTAEQKQVKADRKIEKLKKATAEKVVVK